METQIGTARCAEPELLSSATDPKRSDWSFVVASELQRAVSAVLRPTLEDFQQEIAELARRLPAPRDSAQRRELHQRLIEFSLRIGRSFHDRYPHGSVDCGFALTESLETWCDPVIEPRTALEMWVGVYGKTFNCYHRPSPALWASRLLRRNVAAPLSLDALAREVGASRSTLVRAFTREFGLSPLEFHTRGRLVVGISALRDGVKVADAARLAGYRSAKNFNHALRKYADLTPSEVRHLPACLFESLRERLTRSVESITGRDGISSPPPARTRTS